MKAYIAYSIGIFLFAFPSLGGAYFEDTYFCSVGNETISVSIHGGAQLCFSYIALISESIDVLGSDLATTDIQIATGEDDPYRQGIRADLLQQQEEMIALRQQFITAVDDYEQELFLKVKSLTSYYLRKQHEDVRSKVFTALQLMGKLKRVGDISSYGFVKVKLDEFQQELLLIDAIRRASDFSELMPVLVPYIQGQRTITSFPSNI